MPPHDVLPDAAQAAALPHGAVLRAALQHDAAPLLDALQPAAPQHDASLPLLDVLQPAAPQHDASLPLDVLQHEPFRRDVSLLLDVPQPRRFSAMRLDCSTFSARAVSARCVSVARRSSARGASQHDASRSRDVLQHEPSRRDASRSRDVLQHAPPQHDASRRSTFFSTPLFHPLRLTRSQCSSRFMRLASARLLLESPRVRRR